MNQGSTSKRIGADAVLRSLLMGRIRGKHTDPELRLRRLLWAEGLRYRLHRRVEGLRPDLVFGRARLAVFIDGCFWHGCPDHYVCPRSREEFWGAKLSGNVARDRKQTLLLEAAGWQVVHVWEHSLYEDASAVVRSIVSALRSKPRAKAEWRVVRVEALTADGRYERRILEDLRKPDRRREVEQVRSTRKWKRSLTAV